MSHRPPTRLQIDDFSTVNRRQLLRALGASALTIATGGLFSRSLWGGPVFAAYPFSFGVASGDPAPDGFVIWTKIAPTPLERGGGMPGKPVEVEWSVALDERMGQVATRGTSVAHPELGHAVHVEVAGLQPARDYYYQFTIGGERSRVGRARTLPPAAVSLQAAHASAPFVMSYDDHEVDNDWAGDTTEEQTPSDLFLLRRAAALQAWYEHLPVRRALLPRGADILAYRRFAVGDLLAMNVLDTRLFRSAQACGDGPRVAADCAERLDRDRTMLGDAQERWLYDGFTSARARWTLLAQQVLVMRNDRDPDPAVFAPSLDKWDGAVAARDRLFAAIEAAKVANVVVVTGDVHDNWAGELKKNFDDEKSATLGVEFVATSVTSDGDGFDINDSTRALLQQDPHIKYFNSQRGYARHIVTPNRWQCDFQVLDRVSVPDGRTATHKSFVVESGRSGLSEA